MRGRNGSSNVCFCSQIPTAIPFNGQGREHSAPVGTCVDSDAIGPFLNLEAYRVTVDDNKAMRCLVRQEWLADPSKIGLALFIESDPGPNSSMNKQIVAEPAGIDESAQERDVLIRNGLANCRHRRFVAGRLDQARIGSIAFEALRAAKPKPASEVLDFAGENAQQHFLVIAEQEDGPDVRVPVSPQPLHDLGRARSAIDEVAEEHQQDLPGLLPADLGVDVVEQPVEQVETTVDVADNVGAASLGTARGAGWI